MIVHLSRYIYDDAKYRIALDPLFPLVELQSTGKRVPASDILMENKFHLVFDEKIDGLQLKEYIAKRQDNKAISIFIKLIIF